MDTLINTSEVLHACIYLTCKYAMHICTHPASLFFVCLVDILSCDPRDGDIMAHDMGG